MTIPFHFKCTTLGHAVSQKETVGNSINVHFEIQHSQISAVPRSTRHHGHLVCMRMHVCGLKRGWCVWRTLWVAANHSRLFPGALEDELSGERSGTGKCSCEHDRSIILMHFPACFSSLQLAFKCNDSGDVHNDFTPLLFTGIPVFVDQIFELDGCHSRRGKVTAKQLSFVVVVIVHQHCRKNEM